LAQPRKIVLRKCFQDEGCLRASGNTSFNCPKAQMKRDRFGYCKVEEDSELVKVKIGTNTQNTRNSPVDFFRVPCVNKVSRIPSYNIIISDYFSCRRYRTCMQLSIIRSQGQSAWVHINILTYKVSANLLFATDF
jgi:hypothetical protein